MLNKWLSQVVAFMLIFLVSSACGDTKKKDDALDPNRLDPIPNNSSYSYVREDLSCFQTESSLSYLSRGTVYGMSNGRATMSEEAFLSTTGNPSLRGLFIHHTNYDFEASTVCDASGSCRDTTTRAATPLPICREDGKYKRVSIEGIGLSSYNHLDKVFHFYRSVPNSKSIPTVELFVLPKFSESTNGSVSVVADNLAYHTKKQAIFVYPRGKIADKIWPNVNLWESPWILAHEGAHHLFKMHFTKMIEPYLAKNPALRGVEESFPIVKLDPKDFFPESTPPTVKLAAARRVTVSEAIGSVNEGFADLFAFYAVGERSDTVNGLTCFTEGRDIASTRFKTGETKAITRQALDAFLANYEIDVKAPAGFYNCDAPDYQDIHIVGSVITYGLNRVYNEAASVKQASNRSVAKGKLALQWLDAMGSYTVSLAAAGSSLPPVEQVLGRYIQEGIKQGTTDGRTLNPIQCQAVRDVFPAYATVWIGSTFVCN